MTTRIQRRRDERAELERDVETLRQIIDSALDNGLDRRTLGACAGVLRDRRRRLEELELRRGRRAAA